MNSIKKFGYFVLAVCACLGFVSCSSEEGGNLDVPKYADVAAKYVISDNNSPVSSVELTEGGNYIVCNNPSTGYAARNASGEGRGRSIWTVGMFRRPAATRAYNPYSDIASGVYTQVGENEYKLEGLGTLKITKDASGNAYSIVISYNDGSTVTAKGEKQNVRFDSSKSNSLCRTWSVAKCRFYAKVNGKKLFDVSAGSYRELMKKLEESTGEDLGDSFGFPDARQMVFAKTGTYMVYYSDDMLAVSTWMWVDEGKGILRYSWDADDMENAQLSGTAKIEFKDNQLVVTESSVQLVDDDDEEDYYGYSSEAGVAATRAADKVEVVLVTTLNEAK